MYSYDRRTHTGVDKSLINRVVTLRDGSRVKVLDVAKSKFGDIFWFKGHDGSTKWEFVHAINEKAGTG